MTIAVNYDVSDLADKLGRIKARKAKLEKKEAEIRQQIIDSGEPVVEGGLFRVTVSDTGSNQTDYKSIVNLFDIPRSVIRKHTRYVDRTTVRVSSL